METIKLDQIIVDHDIQIREATNTDAINEYSENIDSLPPITIFRDSDGKNWLADGFHRYQATVKAKKLRIKCEVRIGSKRDAILFACGANRSHGLRRTNADKRRAVERLLADSEWWKWSDKKLAEQAGVSNQFVANLRSQVSTVDTSNEKNTKKTPETRLGKDGKTYPVKAKQPTPAEPLFEAEPDENSGNEAKENEPAWVANRDRADSFRVRINELIRDLKDLPNEPGLERMHSYRAHIVRDLEAAKLNLRGCTPEHICPYCHGRDSECNACKGHGWVTKSEFTQAPKEMRDEVERISNGGDR